MAARRRKITIDGDYEIVRGSPSEDSTHVSTAIFLLSLRHGSCPVAPNLGNRLYVELRKLGDDAPRRAEQYARDALSPLTRSRDITDLVIDVTVDGSSLLHQISFTDKDGVQRALSFPIPRGT